MALDDDMLAAAMKRSALRHQLVSARTPAACSEALDHMLPLRSAKEYGLAIKACGQRRGGKKGAEVDETMCTGSHQQLANRLVVHQTTRRT